jgi:hypothetical protein
MYAHEEHFLDRSDPSTQIACFAVGMQQATVAMQSAEPLASLLGGKKA